MPFPFLAAAAIAKKAWPLLKAGASKVGSMAGSPVGTAVIGAGAGYAGSAMALRGSRGGGGGGPRINPATGLPYKRRRKGMSTAHWGNVMLAGKILGKNSPGMTMVGMKVAGRIL